MTNWDTTDNGIVSEWHIELMRLRYGRLKMSPTLGSYILADTAKGGGCPQWLLQQTLKQVRDE